MTVLMAVRTVTVDMCMCVFMPGLIHVSMFVKMLVCVSVSVFVIICHFSLLLILHSDIMNFNKRALES